MDYKTMNARELAEALAEENPNWKVIIDLGGFKAECMDIELCEHEGEPCIELTAGPRDADEDEALGAWTDKDGLLERMLRDDGFDPGDRSGAFRND